MKTLYYTLDESFNVNISDYPFRENGMDAISAEFSDEDAAKALSSDWQTVYDDGDFTFVEITALADMQEEGDERLARMNELKGKIHEGTITDQERDELFLLLLGENTTIEP